MKTLKGIVDIGSTYMINDEKRDLKSKKTHEESGEF